jgi:hypothetical protein
MRSLKRPDSAANAYAIPSLRVWATASFKRDCYLVAAAEMAPLFPIRVYAYCHTLQREHQMVVVAARSDAPPPLRRTVPPVRVPLSERAAVGPSIASMGLVQPNYLCASEQPLRDSQAVALAARTGMLRPWAGAGWVSSCSARRMRDSIATWPETGVLRRVPSGVDEDGGGVPRTPFPCMTVACSSMRTSPGQ